MGCRSCAEQRKAAVKAIARGQVATAVKILVNGAAQIVRDVAVPPRRTKPKGR